MSPSYAGQISYDEFVQRVRRHRPSDLLPAIAATAIAMSNPSDYMTTGQRLLTPWALGAAAKESIVSGNEHRHPGVTDHDILEICGAFAAQRDPLGDRSSPLAPVSSFFMRMASEQFPFQISPFEEIARVQALFGDRMGTVPTEVLTEEALERVLGISVLDYVGIGLLLHVGAQRNAGYFDPRWLAQPNFAPICDVIPAAKILNVFHRHFATDVEGFRAQARAHREPTGRLRRYEFNPLVARPFIAQPDGRYLAPQPHYVLQRISPAAIYYVGADQLGDAFTRDMGQLFQDYVGRQLAQLPDAEIYPEVIYDGDNRTVDWFVVWDQLLLLVEAKSTRLTLGARMGMDRLGGDLDRAIGRAFHQIDRTARLLENRHPALRHLPEDRPARY